MNDLISNKISPIQTGWALLFLLFLSGFLRLFNLENAPPGLYHDEAYNGLDALSVIDGFHPLYFTENNGREPAYIYLTALAISIFGHSAFALRLPAAIAGILTSWLTYQLGTVWFNRRIGLYIASLWTITLWPIHLSRIGLRAILAIPLITLFLWLLTLSFQTTDRSKKTRFAILAGFCYGVSFYTYLTVRFSLLPLTIFFIYFYCFHSRTIKWRTLTFSLISWLITIFPLMLTLLTIESTSRIGQVSILNPTINEGRFWGTLWTHIWQAAGMFLYKGDFILRHNPYQRPVFDLFIALPFLFGTCYTLYHWRKPAYFATLLWVATMLGPTILAEDTPHFLRASGILPAILFLPAIGIEQLTTYLPQKWRLLFPFTLFFLSLSVTVYDYTDYQQQPDTAYFFEDSATKLAHDIMDNNQLPIYLDEQLWQSWPSVRYLLSSSPPHLFNQSSPPPPHIAKIVYTWPYHSNDYLQQSFPGPAVLTTAIGPLTRGDLEIAPYSLYTRYTYQEQTVNQSIIFFNNQIILQQYTVTPINQTQLQIDLWWQWNNASPLPMRQYTLFLHLMEDNQLRAQIDQPLMDNQTPFPFWQSQITIHQQYLLPFPNSSDSDEAPYIVVGLYDSFTQERLPIFNLAGIYIGDNWPIHIQLGPKETYYR